MRQQFRQHSAVKQCREMYVSFLLWITERIQSRYALLTPPAHLSVDFLSCAHPCGPIRVATPSLPLDIVQEQQRH
jgi:hypothetical protein